MSVVTAQPMKCAPSAAAGVSATSGGGSWTSGSWVELLSATGAEVVIQGFVGSHSAAAGASYELDIGYGAAGSETVLGTYPFRAPNSGNKGQRNLHAVIPVSGIGNGVRIAARIRSATASQSLIVTVLYTESFDSDHVTTKAPSAMPSAAVGSNMTPSGTAWNNSSWVQCTSGIGNDIMLAYWVSNPPVAAAVDFEIDVGIGGAGSEVVVTTLRGWVDSASSGCCVWWLPFPAAFPVAANTRVATRIRKTGTNTSTWSTGFMYYHDLSIPATSFVRAWLFGF